MSIKDKLPAEEIMQEMTKLALEQAFQVCARQARKHAAISEGLDGKEVMLAFARAIENTNAKVWPKGKSR